MSNNELLMTTDMMVWSEEFCRIFDGKTITAATHPNDDVDGGTMVAWLANAFELGRSTGRKETCSHENCIGLAENLWACRRCGRVADHWPMEDGDGDTAPPEASLEDHFKEGFDEARG